MNTPPIKFSTKQLEVELSDYTLPRPPIQFGGRQRNTVTTYSDDYVTVQSHGVEMTNIEIGGILKDGYLGENGAQKIRSDMTALMESRDVVKFEYDKEQLWGLFEVTFDERWRGDLSYRIRFKPLWRQDPAKIKPIEYIDAPVTAAAKINSYKDDFSKEIQNPPVEIQDQAEIRRLITDSLKTDIAIGEFTSTLAKIDNLTNLHFLQLQHLAALSIKAQTALAIVDKITRKMTPESLTGLTTAQKIRTALWIWRVQKRLRFLRYEQFINQQRISEQIRPLIVKQYVVKQGDTLPKIANDVFGDFNRWSEIADANNIKDGFVTPGEVLRIPR